MINLMQSELILDEFAGKFGYLVPTFGIVCGKETKCNAKFT